MSMDPLKGTLHCESILANFVWTKYSANTFNMNAKTIKGTLNHWVPFFLLKSLLTTRKNECTPRKLSPVPYRGPTALSGLPTVSVQIILSSLGDFFSYVGPILTSMTVLCYSSCNILYTRLLLLYI